MNHATTENEPLLYIASVANNTKPRSKKIAILPQWMQSLEWTCEYCGKRRQVKDFTGHSARKCGKCLSKESAERHHHNGDWLPMEESKDSGLYLGVHIAERALSKFFDNTIRMPFGNPGYDFVCGKGFKIDAKSSCLHYPRAKGVWNFGINKNKIADYFIFLAFDNRENLAPMHVWLIPGNAVNDRVMVEIRNTERGLSRFAEYERPLDRVVACCSDMRAAAE